VYSSSSLTDAYPVGSEPNQHVSSSLQTGSWRSYMRSYMRSSINAASTCFSKLCRAIASLEPAPINVRIACGKPPQNANTKCAAPTKNSVRWGRPREIQRPCRALLAAGAQTGSDDSSIARHPQPPFILIAIKRQCVGQVIIFAFGSCLFLLPQVTPHAAAGLGTEH